VPAIDHERYWEFAAAVRFVEGVSWGRKRQAFEPSGEQGGVAAAIRSAKASALVPTLSRAS
jgi:hypothetical protein